ncbi:MAG: RdgB/HAM1 family non-canonical purine NTP pyrophosphatase [Candidatus Omnitrophota bacterium]
MEKILLLATKNWEKLKELQELLDGSGWRVIALSDFPDCPDAVEDGKTFEENARIKAVAASTHTGLLTLADDSGLEVDALGLAPGIYSARYARGDDSTDEENTAKVLAEMKDVPDERRTARFVCAAVIARGEEILFTTRQTAEGFIAREPRGSGGFGYDPIFYYPSFGQNFAEVPPPKKHSVSHRGKALRAAVEFLQALIE